ncbi:MAG: VWA domain-containing protein [Treponema sp.]|nr:VWA domain-containing protein [Treponema sp.]
MKFFKSNKNLIIVQILVLFLADGFLFAQPSSESQTKKIEYTIKQKSMKLSVADVRIVPESGDAEFGKGGYHLYVKKLPSIRSILLTETTKDPTGKSDSYAYRALEYNPINGDEVRYLDGKPLVSEGAKYSLVDSTTEKHPELGEAFHIYIPQKLLFGYEWSRHGQVEIGQGTFINIRTFEKPYADYTGEYMDSPFMFNLETRRRPKEKEEIKKEEKPPVVLDDKYNPAAGEKFKEISDDLIYSKGPETIVKDVLDVFKNSDKNEKLDVVLAIDATGSMKNDIEKLKKDLIPSLQATLIDYSSLRIGLLFYRDYKDNFSYKGLPVNLYAFTDDFSVVNKNLNALVIRGNEGGDVPEAVYEAIYASTQYYLWRENANKRIILIGDAEPHPTPRGTKKYSKDFVLSFAASKGIDVTAILLPED